jgi:hypothetical protein
MPISNGNTEETLLEQILRYKPKDRLDSLTPWKRWKELYQWFLTCGP